ncbi:MAG: nucleotidyltransferase domain-containing protein [Mycobacteriales bacterium]
MTVDEAVVIAALRAAGAQFALAHGSRTADGPSRPDSDLDIGAWWGSQVPDSWDVPLPSYVDLVVLNTAPLWLAGRIAQHGQLLFDDDPASRVRWQAETRLRYLDDIPALRRRYQQRSAQLAHGSHGG